MDENKDAVEEVKKTEEKVSIVDVKNPVNPKKSSIALRILFLVLSVVIAFGIWVYASSLQSRTSEVTFNDIPVKISTASGFSILNPYEYTMDVTVSGTAANLKKLSKDSFSATVDATDKEEAGKYSFTVSLDYPSTVQLVNQSVHTVVLELDRIATASFDVEISLGNYEISEPYEIAKIECESPSVTVTGPSKIVSRIAKAAVKADVGRLTESTTYGGTVEFYDESGAVVDATQLSLSSTNPEVYIQVFSKKTVPLKVSFAHGYFDAVQADVTVSPSYITIKGESSDLATINEIVLEDIDERLFTGSTIEKEIVLPDRIYLSSSQSTAKISVKLSGSSDSSYFINSKYIQINNPNNLKCELLVRGVEVTLRGPSSTMSGISKYVITASVDLSNYNSGSGTVSIPVTVVIPQELSGTVYEVGSYTLLAYIGS